MSKEKIRYNEAIEELEQIVKDMEYGEISVDELSVKIKRSAFLIEFCKKKLKSTEEDVENILKEID